MNKEDKLFSE